VSSRTRFQVLFYLISNWHYCVFVEWIHFPRIRTFVEKCFHGLFSKKKGSKSGGVPSFMNWSWGQLLTLADEITWITWKTEQILEIWPFLNSRLEVDFVQESRWLYDGLNRIGCRNGLSFLLTPMVTDYKQVMRDRTTGSEIFGVWMKDVTCRYNSVQVRDDSVQQDITHRVPTSPFRNTHTRASA